MQWLFLYEYSFLYVLLLFPYSSPLSLVIAGNLKYYKT